MEGEKSIPSSKQSSTHNAGAEYVEIDLRKLADGVFIKPASRTSRMSKSALFAALICGLALGTAVTWYFSRTAAASQTVGSADVSQSPAGWTARGFYLTKASVSGGAATAACSPGFHMASLYEVLNVSALRYDTTLGLKSGDSGHGPPALAFGWIRTGSDGEPLRTCNDWTSSAPSLYQGLVVRLNDLTGPPAAYGVQPWEFLGFGEQNSSANCAVKHNVWCVQD
jgi:hypothetical protein